MLLDKFRAAKQEEIANLKKQKKQDLLRLYPQKRPSLSQALSQAGPGAIIAEYKRASPSKGIINLDYSPQEVGSLYANNGAAAISVLTEKKYFQGSLKYLEIMAETGLPLLRKDFIFHPLQVEQTATSKAAGMLLIVRMFETASEIRALLDQAASFGLEVVVEIFAPQELSLAREALAGYGYPHIIQINNRDLDTLDIDLQRSLSLIGEKQLGEQWIAASGIYTSEQADTFRQAGFDGLLIGTSLMSDPNPASLLRDLSRR